MIARHGALALAALVLVLGSGCSPTAPPADDDEPRFDLTPVGFADLRGWHDDDMAAALGAFRRSCERLDARSPDAALANNPAFGLVADWLDPCRAAREAGFGPDEVQRYFTTWFVPYRVSNGGDASGLFTGYYEPLLNGSRRPGGRYRYPLHRRPDDLISVDLGQFDSEMQGRTIAGRIAQGRLAPYAARDEIERGGLDGRNLELVWVDDEIDKFFLQIQGSGQVALDDGSLIRVGYDGKNGRAYRAIGRDLIEMGELTRETVSLQSIRAWLRANPGRAEDVMNRNPSYVFFRELGRASSDLGPPGAQGIALTPGRSLAVDRRYFALGVPIWIDASAPFPEGQGPLRRLMIAQDTGGAIRGPVRGDVFWGAGPRAESIAGHMKSRGGYYLLLPRSLAPVG